MSAAEGVRRVNGSGGLVDPSLARFVDHHVRSLMAWEIILFFQRHPEAVMDEASLAGRLGRRPDDIADDVELLCRSEILSCAGGLIRYAPVEALSHSVDRFADACTDRSVRMALVAQVLERIDRTFHIS
jgi:hypothetical protein